MPFIPIELEPSVIKLPEGYERMFCDMDSLKSYMISRMTYEAELVIRNGVVTQMKDMEFYEVKART
tara:strand:- start:9238 stop:9435 length:198 start_codon:yes stop_codon:yes gene_type:complete